MQQDECATAQTCCPIVELRQYTLVSGQRDVLIDLFEREFIESQEAVGMKVIGQFRDLDDPNRFVWLRGFPDMDSRTRSLSDFYTGPVWIKHREAANATMVDSDNVLLLRPALPTSGFKFGNDRPALGANNGGGGLLVATIYYLQSRCSEDFVGFFERSIKPVLQENGASILASFVTENRANTFPRLPVREGENVFVWFARFDDEAAHEVYLNALARSPRSSGDAWDELGRCFKHVPEELRLSPTARSHLRG
jgi:NIPSNAP protein